MCLFRNIQDYGGINMAKKVKKKEEEKEEEIEDEDDESGFGLGKIVKVLLGLVLIAAGLYSYKWWWPELLMVIKGCLGVFIALIGLVVVMIGWSD